MRQGERRPLPWTPVVGRRAASGLRWLELTAGVAAVSKFLGGKIYHPAFGGRYVNGIAHTTQGRVLIYRLLVLLRARLPIPLCDVDSYYAAGRRWPLGMTVSEDRLIDIWPSYITRPTAERKMSENDDALNVFLFMVEPKSVWGAAPIADEPEIALIDWAIKKDTAGNAYFVGTRADDGSGRVSTAIVEIDLERRRGRTQSGRVYELLGPSGYSDNGEYVWSLYRVANGIQEAKS